MAAIPVIDATVGLSVAVLVGLAALGAVFDPAGVTARETLLPAAASSAGWRLEKANGVHEAVWGVAFLVGPGVGGLLIALVGAANTLWVTAAAFAVSVVLISLVRLPGASGPAAHDRPEHFWRATAEGLVFVWQDRLLRTTALLVMAVVAVYLPIEAVILPVVFTQQDAPGRLGALLIAMSAGGVVGSLAYGRWGHLVPRRRVFVAGLVGVGVPLVGMATLPPFPIMLALGVLTGLCYGPLDPLINWAMQTRTPERLRGRVMGIMIAADYTAGPIGLLAAGPMVERFGVRTAFLTITVVLFHVALLALPAAGLRAFDDPPRFPGAPEADDVVRRSGATEIG